MGQVENEVATCKGGQRIKVACSACLLGRIFLPTYEHENGRKTRMQRRTLRKSIYSTLQIFNPSEEIIGSPKGGLCEINARGVHASLARLAQMFPQRRREGGMRVIADGRSLDLEKLVPRWREARLNDDDFLKHRREICQSLVGLLRQTGTSGQVKLRACGGQTRELPSKRVSGA